LSEQKDTVGDSYVTVRDSYVTVRDSCVTVGECKLVTTQSVVAPIVMSHYYWRDYTLCVYV